MEPQRQTKESAAVASTKRPVDSETTYPRPHNQDSLLSVLFTDPGKFEGMRL